MRKTATKAVLKPVIRDVCMKQFISAPVVVLPNIVQSVIIIRLQIKKKS